MEKSEFSLRGRNLDVLTCIAILSNDDVFTPLDFANHMLDTLADAWAAGHDGADIWTDPTVRFLDPRTKSGVFPREIATRLNHVGCTTPWWRLNDAPAFQPCDAGHRLQHRPG